MNRLSSLTFAWPLLFASVFLSLGLFAQPAATHAQNTPTPSISVSMRSDLMAVSLNETFRLQIRVEAVQLKPEKILLPDLSNFEIVNERTSQPSSGMQVLFNGQFQVIRQSSTLKTLTLRPKAKGLFKLEPAKVISEGKTYTSDALEIEVTDPDGGVTNQTQATTGIAATGATTKADNSQSNSADGFIFDSNAFLRTVVDNVNPFVGEQVKVSVYLYVKEALVSSPMVTKEPSASAFWVQNLLPGSRKLEGHYQTIRGITYRTYLLRQFSAFPLNPGILSITAPEAEIETGSFFTRSRRFTRKGVDVEVNAQPLPNEKQFPGALTGRFSIEADLDRQQAVTGDALTFKIRAQGNGNVRNVQFNFPNIPGLRVLQPQTESRSEIVGGEIRSEKSVTWIIVPKNPGKFKIPSFKFFSFDPQSKKYTTHKTDPIPFTVEGNPVQGNKTEEQAPDDKADKPDTSTIQDHPKLSLGPFRTQSRLLMQPLQTTLPSGFWPLSVLPFLLWLGVFIISHIRGKNPQKTNTTSSILKIEKELSEILPNLPNMNYSFCSTQISHLLKQAVELYLNEPIGSFTFSELNKKLQLKGVPEEISLQLVKLLEFFEQGRFSAQQKSSKSLEEKIKQTIERLKALRNSGSR